MATSHSRPAPRRKHGRPVPLHCGGRCWWPSGCGRGRRARRSMPSSTARWHARLHGREGVLRERARALRHRQSLSARGGDGKLPAVLCPHGHWPDGRFHDVAEAERREQSPRAPSDSRTAARHILQARSVQLARMGCVVFLYDMVGYADSVQIPRAIAHSPARPNTHRDRRRAVLQPAGRAAAADRFWGSRRGTPSARSTSSAGLPDVDPARIAVTGASGGGTQTFILGAIDDRPAVAFPAVMVSTRMQGGCTCENADYLRVGTGNIELAALFAPKPLGMTAADDWTRDDADRRVSRVAETLRPVWRSRQGAALPVPAVRAQLQPREPRGDVRLGQPPPRPRRRRAGHRARLRAAHARRGDGLDAGASRAGRWRGERARGDRVVDRGHRPTTSTDAAG